MKSAQVELHVSEAGGTRTGVVKQAVHAADVTFPEPCHVSALRRTPRKGACGAAWHRTAARRPRAAAGAPTEGAQRGAPATQFLQPHACSHLCRSLLSASMCSCSRARSCRRTSTSFTTSGRSPAAAPSAQRRSSGSPRRRLQSSGRRSSSRRSSGRTAATARAPAVAPSLHGALAWPGVARRHLPSLTDACRHPGASRPHNVLALPRLACAAGAC